AVFASARQAIRATVDLQARFVQETVDDPSLPLPVGIGLDAGEAVPVEGGYRGGALNLAARLCGQAGPGEVLASQEVVHLARKVDGVVYVDRGQLTLKGLSDPVRVVAVRPEGEDPALKLAPFTTRPPVPSGPKRTSPTVKRAMVAGLALAILAAVIIPVVLLRGGSGGHPVATGPGIGVDSAGLIDPETGLITAQVSLGARPNQ